jgi:DNA polymerase IV
MSPKLASDRSSSSSSFTSNAPPSKRRRTSDSTSSLSTAKASEFTKVHILQAKLDSEAIQELFALVDKNADGLHLERCLKVDDAEVVITAVHMRKRLERHLDWMVAVSYHSARPEPLLAHGRLEIESHSHTPMAFRLCQT